MSTNSQHIGQYKLQGLIGRGPMTEVWKATDIQQQRTVAIKIFHPNLQADPDFVSRFLSEARVIVSLHHPNIVAVHDFQVSQPPESESTTPYVVMDYIEGQTLANYIGNTSRLGRFPPAAEIVRLLHPISRAIDYAHQQGIIHNDIKPTNIFLGGPTGSNTAGPRLSDFGMGQILKTPASSLNSAFYTSPEQAQGNADNERSDLYSLGVILYEMFTGTVPFEGDDPADIIKQHLGATPTPPALINPNILPAVTAIIMRSLAKDPAIRYASAGAMINALARALNISLTEKHSSPGDPMDAMNSPTYVIPTQQGGRTPSTPSIKAIPFSPSSSSSLPLASTAAGDGRQVPPALMGSMTPVIHADNISEDLPFVQPTKDLPASTSSQSYPLTQLPTLSSGRSAPNLPTITPVQPPPAAPPQKRGRRGLLTILLALLIFLLIASGIGTYVVFILHGNRTGSTPPTVPIVGHAFFISSGLLSSNPESSQGITDQVQLNLQHISSPQPGKSYYAWLLNNSTAELNPVPLGKLTVNSDGTAGLSYPGDAAHTDLLKGNSRFLITEEDASSLPASPSLNPSDWIYYAEFSQKPNTLDPEKFSLYDHLRHLLAADPKLQGVGLSGGLDIWLFRNTEKIVEWSGSARDAWKNKSAANAAFIRRQLARVLGYLDGSTYFQTDLPGVKLLTDQTIAKVALLEFDVQKQTPPGYLYHIGTKHLHGILQLPDATAGQKALALRIDTAINNVNGWLQAVRTDSLQLYKMSDNQLLGDAGRTGLDDLATQTNYAFVGQIDPYTQQVKEGVVEIHYNIQRLATFDIRACTSSDPCTI